MSGHSKWAQIKRQKGTTDARRGQAFTKMANAITIAVRGSGNGDPAQNFKLRLLVEKARAINMPKDNIERAIDRGLGKGDKGSLEEVVYEGFTPGGVAVIAEGITDNKQRTTPEVKSVFEKNGGTLGNSGSVAYLFETKGHIIIRKNNTSLDDIFLLAADSGAEDVEEIGDRIVVYTNPDALGKVRDAFHDRGLTIEEAELIRKPVITVEITDKNTAESVLNFIEKIENMDDILKVYANFDIPDNLLS